MSDSKKHNSNITYGGELKHSQRGTNVPTQPTIPKMPAVKPNKNSGKK